MRNLSLSYGLKIGASLQFRLGFSIAILTALPAFAAVPLNDKELNNNYLTNRSLPAQLDVAQYQRVLDFKNPQAITTTFVPVTGLSTLTYLLNERDRKDILNASSTYKNAWTFGENGALNFDSEPYSLRWEGNFTDILGIGSSGDYYFNDSSGSYEINNIQGKVVFYVSFPKGTEEAAQFRRSNRVFN